MSKGTDKLLHVEVDFALFDAPHTRAALAQWEQFKSQVQAQLDKAAKRWKIETARD